MNGLFILLQIFAGTVGGPLILLGCWWLSGAICRWRGWPL